MGCNCKYEYWDKDVHELTHCGKPAFAVKVEKKRVAFLCKEHAEFYVDAYNRADIDIAKAHNKEERAAKKRAKT